MPEEHLVLGQRLVIEDEGHGPLYLVPEGEGVQPAELAGVTALKVVLGGGVVGKDLAHLKIYGVFFLAPSEKASSSSKQG